MGDIRQIKFTYGSKELWFYTHWGGSELIKDLKEAIQFAKDRWTDDSYCLRIILTRLCLPYAEQTTGAGVWFTSMDSEYEDPTVDLIDNTVTIKGKTKTFEEFVR